MTEIAFHFGAPRKLAYACRLLRKAVASGSSVLVVADPQAVRSLELDLWCVSPTDFVAHCTDAADAFMQLKSPVLFASPGGAAAPGRQVLVNLTDGVPPGFEDFERVIEVVSTDDADRESARSRWKHYTALGYRIQRHDLALKGGN